MPSKNLNDILKKDIPYETKHPPEMVQDGPTARNLKSNEGGYTDHESFVEVGIQQLVVDLEL
ncbi:hypothetical protein SDJN02_18456, partial [Cucurbita argyrosperma subsp. argyrosperma]